MAKVNPIVAAVMGLLVVTIVLSIVAFATPAWTQNNVNSFGIFRHCYGDNCIDRIAGSPYKKATAAFGVMAMIAQCSSLFFLGFCFYKDMKMLKVAASVLIVIGMVFLLIACAVFTGLHLLQGSSNWFGYSFYIGWVAFIFNTFTAIVAIVGAAHKIEE